MLKTASPFPFPFPFPSPSPWGSSCCCSASFFCPSYASCSSCSCCFSCCHPARFSSFDCTLECSQQATHGVRANSRGSPLHFQHLGPVLLSGSHDHFLYREIRFGLFSLIRRRAEFQVSRAALIHTCIFLACSTVGRRQVVSRR